MCTSLMANYAKHLFMFVHHLCIFLGEISILSPLPIWVVGLPTFVLYVLWIQDSCQICDL